MNRVASKTTRLVAAIFAIAALETIILVALGLDARGAAALGILCGATLSLKAIRDGKVDWKREFHADQITSAFAAFRRFSRRPRRGDTRA